MTNAFFGLRRLDAALRFFLGVRRLDAALRVALVSLCDLPSDCVALPSGRQRKAAPKRCPATALQNHGLRRLDAALRFFYGLRRLDAAFRIWYRFAIFLRSASSCRVPVKERLRQSGVQPPHSKTMDCGGSTPLCVSSMDCGGSTPLWYRFAIFLRCVFPPSGRQRKAAPKRSPATALQNHGLRRLDAALRFFYGLRRLDAALRVALVSLCFFSSLCVVPPSGRQRKAAPKRCPATALQNHGLRRLDAALRVAFVSLCDLSSCVVLPGPVSLS
jgi:hypothetical protein